MEPFDPPLENPQPDEPQGPIEEPELIPDVATEGPEDFQDPLYEPTVWKSKNPLEDMELTDMLVGNMVEDSKLALCGGPDLLLSTKSRGDLPESLNPLKHPPKPSPEP